MKDEDYRWAVLRAKRWFFSALYSATPYSVFSILVPGWLFQIFNLSFVAIIQHILLLGLSYPTYIAAVEQPHTSLSFSDVSLAALALGVLLTEFTADNQQYSYQTFKLSYLGKGETYDETKQWPGARLNWTAEDAKRGFITKG